MELGLNFGMGKPQAGLSGTQYHPDYAVRQLPAGHGVGWTTNFVAGASS
jgi:hypothetical protein